MLNQINDVKSNKGSLQLHCEMPIGTFSNTTVSSTKIIHTKFYIINTNPYLIVNTHLILWNIPEHNGSFPEIKETLKFGPQ
jgi:hypothetical protein